MEGHCVLLRRQISRRKLDISESEIKFKLTTQRFEFLNAEVVRMQSLSRFLWGSSPAELNDTTSDIHHGSVIDTIETRVQVVVVHFHFCCDIGELHPP